MNLADELECYSKIMHNAYLLVTEQKSIDELDLDITSADITYESYLPFNPENNDGKDPATLSLLIDYYTSLGDVAKCKKLKKLEEV
jgi:hypothetical protein